MADLVYSTDPDWEKPKSGVQDFRVWRQRIKGNKVVTIVRGYKGDPNTLKEMSKVLRKKCGAGGNVKDKEIILQGDHAEKVVEHLLSLGHKAKRAGG